MMDFAHAYIWKKALENLIFIRASPKTFHFKNYPYSIEFILAYDKIEDYRP